MPKNKEMISSEEARIMLLEQKNDDFYQALKRIDQRFDQMEKRFDQMIDQTERRFDKLDARMDRLDSRMDRLDSRMDRLDSKIDSNLKWLLTFIIPSFIGVLGLIAHGLKWI